MIIITCPHCNAYIEIEQINCAIFRHACYKNNMQQINPHLSKSECERLINENLIYGCGKPFMIVPIQDGHEARICDYI